MLGFLGRSYFLFDMSFNGLQIYFFVSHLTEPVPPLNCYEIFTATLPKALEILATGESLVEISGNSI